MVIGFQRGGWEGKVRRSIAAVGGLSFMLVR